MSHLTDYLARELTRQSYLDWLASSLAKLRSRPTPVIGIVSDKLTSKPTKRQLLNEL